MNDRFFRNNVIEDFDPQSSFIRIDNPNFRGPASISLEKIGEKLKIKVDDNLLKNIESRNISSLKFSSIDENPSKAPSDLKLSSIGYVSVDENYLYIWVETLKKWKRIPMMDWK